MSKYIEQYPWLRLMNMYTGRLYKNRDAMDELQSFAPGWYSAFGEMFCKELDEVIKKNNLQDDFVVLQIKEKFGKLRFYYNDKHQYNDDIAMICEKYEYISKFICMNCGSKNGHILKLAYIHPLCRQCFKKEYPKSDESYDELAEQDAPHSITYRLYKDRNVLRTNAEYVDIDIDVCDTMAKIKEVIPYDND